MCDIEVCRICLRDKYKLYDLNNYNLKKYYEEITNKSINITDGLPPYFCYECAALLLKFHTFREKCDYGDKVLKEMLWNGPLTYDGIQEFNTKDLYQFNHLTLDILVSNKRIKTYTYREKDVDLVKTEIIHEEFTAGPFSDDENFACNDPESDPVDYDLPLDGDIKDNKDDNTEPHIIESTIFTKEVDPQPAKVPLKINLKEIFKIEVVENKIAQKNTAAPESVKPTRNAKSKQITKLNKNTKPIKRKGKPVSSDDDSDDDIELSKIKSSETTSVISPPTKKTYKFNKPKRDRTGFLNSEYWKKTILTDEEAMEEFQKKALEKKYIDAPYKCELCYRKFSQKSILDRHMPQRHAESLGALSCRFCKMRFRTNCFLAKHLRQHYDRFKCLRCGYVCVWEDATVLHEEYHRGVKRKCPHCQKEFHHLSSFYTHLRSHRSKHICSLCGDSFVSEMGLRQHKRIKHRTENDTINVEGAMYCEVCKMNFETKDAYQNHLAHSAMHLEENKQLGAYLLTDTTDEADKILEENDTDSQSDTPVKPIIHRVSEVEKQLCAVRKSGKGRDTSTRLSKKPTTCKHCGAKFASQLACVRHHGEAHRGKSRNPGERVVCEICGASLALGSIAAHLNMHTQSKLFTCDTCGRSFTSNNVLKNHQVTHTGERNHVCSLCDKRFSLSSGLYLHFRTIHLKIPCPKRNRNKVAHKEEE